MKGFQIFLFFTFIIGFLVMPVTSKQKRFLDNEDWWIKKAYKYIMGSSSEKKLPEPTAVNKLNQTASSYLQELKDSKPLERVGELFNRWILDPVNNFLYPSSYQDRKRSLKNRVDSLIKEHVSMATSGFPIPGNINEKIVSTVTDIWDSRPVTTVRKFMSQNIVKPVQDVLPKQETYPKCISKTLCFVIGVVIGTVVSFLFNFIPQICEYAGVNTDLLDDIREWRPKLPDLASAFSGKKEDDNEEVEDEDSD